MSLIDLVNFKIDSLGFSKQNEAVAIFPGYPRNNLGCMHCMQIHFCSG